MPRTNPTAKNYLDQNVNSVNTEKPQCDPIKWSSSHEVMIKNHSLNFNMPSRSIQPQSRHWSALKYILFPQKHKKQTNCPPIFIDQHKYTYNQTCCVPNFLHPLGSWSCKILMTSSGHYDITGLPKWNFLEGFRSWLPDRWDRSGCSWDFLSNMTDKQMKRSLTGPFLSTIQKSQGWHEMPMPSFSHWGQFHRREPHPSGE